MPEFLLRLYTWWEPLLFSLCFILLYNDDFVLMLLFVTLLPVLIFEEITFTQSLRSFLLEKKLTVFSYKEVIKGL